MQDHQPYEDDRTDEDIKASNDSILKTVNDISWDYPDCCKTIGCIQEPLPDSDYCEYCNDI